MLDGKHNYKKFLGIFIYMTLTPPPKTVDMGSLTEVLVDTAHRGLIFVNKCKLHHLVI